MQITLSAPGWSGGMHMTSPSSLVELADLVHGIDAAPGPVQGLGVDIGGENLEIGLVTQHFGERHGDGVRLLAGGGAGAGIG